MFIASDANGLSERESIDTLINQIYLLRMRES
jgi:hypothetical protein